MARDAEIDAQRLLVDEENPRLPDGIRNQRDAAQVLAEYQGPRLIALAKHIAEHGLNPAQRFIVMRESGSRDYVVLDGNRRLVALKAVETPAAFGSLPAGRIRALKKLDASKMPRKVPCVIVDDRIEAEPWIRLTHLDQRGGVGQSKWSTAQKAKHEERLGSKPVTLQLLDYVRANGELSAATITMIDNGRFPMTMIERMLETRNAKPKMGVDIGENVVRTSYPREQVLRPWAKFVDDIGTGRQDSRTLNTAKQRAEYLAGFKANELPNPATEGSDPVPLDEAPAATVGAGGGARSRKARAKDRPASSKRPYMIPDTFAVNIPQSKIHDIYLELKTKVRVDDSPYAAGALFRVFFEMSLSLYCKRHNLSSKGDEFLKENLAAVGGHLITTKAMTEKSVNAVRTRVLERETGFATLQAIMHNVDVPVTGTDLRAIWDGIQPMIPHLWP